MPNSESKSSSFRTGALTAFFFAIGIFPVFYFFRGNIAFVVAPIGGVIFGAAMTAFISAQQRKLDEKIGNSYQGSRVVKAGLANHWLGKESRGGFLVLVEDALHFESHGGNIQNEPLALKLSEITDVIATRSLGVIPNQLTVFEGDVKHKFVVSGNGDWVEKIQNQSASPDPVSKV